MIYLFLGEYKTALNKANDLAIGLLKKQPEASLVKINSENFSAEIIDDLVATQGLFFNKNIILVSKICAEKEAKEILVKRLKEIKESPNIFIFTEEELDKKTLEKFQKNAEKVQEVSGGKTRGESGSGKNEAEFNIFSLTDALGRRDKKNLWLLYLEAIKKNAAEEIYGILWWQLKSMLLVLKSKSAGDTGLKPFVYSKARDFNKNFKEGEVEGLAYSLICLYHNSRRQSSSLEVGLEKWILEI